MALSHRLIWIVAATFAVVLATACERNTATEATGARSDRTAGQRAGDQMDRAATDAKQQTNKVGDKISDAAISAKVKSAIIAEPGLKAMQINVDTVDGIVTLTGTVDSPQLLDNAKQVARSVDGVRSVNNQLTVRASS